MLYSHLIAVILLVLFTFVATVDGLYFHLYKYRLFKRKESIVEHHLHTLNSFLFPFTVFFLFVINCAGYLLWICVFLSAITLLIEFLDVFEEKSSRKRLGGLTSLEYSMHFSMSAIRASYTTLILSWKPFSAWSLKSPLVLQALQESLLLKTIGICVAILGIPVFILHWYLGRGCEKQ
jgi:hypothetical protein